MDEPVLANNYMWAIEMELAVTIENSSGLNLFNNAEVLSVDEGTLNKNIYQVFAKYQMSHELMRNSAKA